ncbi:MAG TPA: c-type cytochrome [Gemmataceae bacterium]|nr:c-type cytochrome [Gemmataceae bacterium]
MAATDQTYRNQRTLDIIFAVSCILMLLSVVVMFAQDYYRPFKVQQRVFRDVETAVFERAMVEKLPDEQTLAKIKEAEEKLAAARAELKKEEDKVQREVRDLQARRVRLEADLQGIKATYDSLVSLRNIDVDHGHTAAAQAKDARLQQLATEMGNLQDQIDAVKAEMEAKLAPVKAKEKELAWGLYQEWVEAGLAPAAAANDIQTLSQAEDPIKRATADLDRLAKTTATKRWKFGDWFRSLPVIDGFASPYRIEQYTLDKLPIDYNFKHVTRFDRCHTCHLGIERANFDRETLTRLKDAPAELQGRLDKVRQMFAERQKRGEELGFDPDDLPTRVVATPLSPSQITQYCAHPRLDLFVDSNSPHPAEKFGCTICHSGQGSATDFNLASHTPNNAVQRAQWVGDHHWESNHYWDFPMLPSRFIESSCLKCHHEVTDLIRYGSKVEAPKLIRGYNLVREHGCFGCHEIAGIKGGRPVGPDLRLEPNPPLEAMTAAERTKMLADPLNPPGKMRKVGPSLYRLVEKTNADWVRKWILSPRGFRPDTRMPHFYGLSNNRPDVLPEDQKDFPAAEIHAITHYLFHESRAYLGGKDKYRRDTEERRRQLLQKEKELKEKQANATLSERERKELIELERRLELAAVPTPLLPVAGQGAVHLTDGEGNVITELPPVADEKQRIEGARLFRERGCLACHTHEAAAREERDAHGVIPGVISEADFGPDLTRIAAKIAPEVQDPKEREKARRAWLIQWILNPNVHFPRTRMPITHLTVPEAAKVADWLLSQPVADWDEPEVPQPSAETLVALARVYLSKAPGVTREDTEKFLREGIPPNRLDAMAYDADERELQGPITADKLKWYIGRKAISRLGCYGCHNIPGFEFAKPIGTPLNDWGKKDVERLAFEDVETYIRNHYHIVPLRDDPKDPSKPAADWQVKDGKEPYEEFFYESLAYHQHDQNGRPGFLHQKLLEPRSFDYNRERTWDDRLRMPQFRFAPTKKRPDESDEAYRARALREEAEAREAVMTFILGLVAEPIPFAYLNNPSPDRLAEVKGRQVLDKFNCAGCHQVRAGVYDFKLTPEVLQQLQDAHSAVQANAAADYADVFRDDNAWVGPPPPTSGRLRLFAVPQGKEDVENKRLSVWLTEAVRFLDDTKKPANIPAGEQIFNLPTTDLVARADPYGGHFTELLVPYLTARRPGAVVDENTARAGLPPPLVREGEKVQPGWLFQFLRNPGKIRPQLAEGDGFLILRMPKFNMSDEEAQALVNYFGAADRLANPGYGLNYPYLTIKQREEEFWREQSKEYREALGAEALKERAQALEAIWKQYRQDLEEQLKEVQERLKAAEAEVVRAKEAEAKADKDKKKLAADAVTRAMNNRDSLKKYAEGLQARLEEATPEALTQRWQDRQVYASDAFRLLVRGPCLACHQAGGLGVAAKGPPLDLSAERLRPEWTERWLANPRRLITYQTPMPQNFPRNQKEYQDLFKGTSREQVKALADLLMDLPKQAALPANRYYLTSPGGD